MKSCFSADFGSETGKESELEALEVLIKLNLEMETADEDEDAKMIIFF